MIDLVYKDENYYPKAFFEKYNFNGKIEIHSHDSYNVDSDEEYSDDSDDYDEKNPMKKIQMEKIKCINLSLKKTSYLISSHPKMLDNFFIEILEIFIFQTWQVPSWNIRNFF